MTDNGKFEYTLKRIFSGTIECIDVFTQLVTVVSTANGRRKREREKNNTKQISGAVYCEISLLKLYTACNMQRRYWK